MSALERIAYFQNRRDEKPNQELARRLAAGRDRDGIAEIAENLWNSNGSIQADCLKVLYEIGYIDPTLIAGYAEDFIKLLHSRNNRLVWGGMIALGTVAGLRAPLVMAHLDEIQAAMRKGSVITVDNGIQVLAQAASKDGKYARQIAPILVEHLRTCRPKDVPQHAEKCLPAVNAGNRARFLAALDASLPDLSGAGLARVTKVIKHIG